MDYVLNIFGVFPQGIFIVFRPRYGIELACLVQVGAETLTNDLGGFGLQPGFVLSVPLIVF